MIDEWNGFAVLLADLIEKYATDLDIDSLPNPVLNERENKKYDTNQNDIETAMVP